MEKRRQGTEKGEGGDVNILRGGGIPRRWKVGKIRL